MNRSRYQPKRTQTRSRLREVEQPVGRNETKHEKFCRIADQRVTNAIKALRLIHQLTDRDFYDFSEAERDRIVGKLAAEVYDIREAFLSSGKRYGSVFDEIRDPTALLMDDLKDVL